MAEARGNVVVDAGSDDDACARIRFRPAKINYQSCVAKLKGIPAIMTTSADPRRRGL